MKKRLVIILSFVFVILLSNLVLGADVGYVLKKSSRADSGFTDVFSDMGLSVELIEDKNVRDVNFSDYKFIFVGDNRLRNLKHISVDDIPGVIVNSKYAKQFGFLDKGRVSKLASNAKLKIKKNGDIVEVYERARFKRGGVGVPYYYLRNKYKSDDVKTVATTYTKRNKELGDVISYLESNGIKKCFFGIIKTKYWTDEARELFKECVEYVVEGVEEPEPEPSPEPEPILEPEEPVCFENIDCGEDEYIGERYCSEGDVYQDKKVFRCINPGTNESYCSNLTEAELIEECYFGCLDGRCLVEEPEPEPSPEPSPEPGEVHDVGLVDFTDAVNKIRIQDKETGDYLIDSLAQLDCSKDYKIYIKVENKGDYTENITFNGRIGDFIFNHNKINNAEPDYVSNPKSKTINIDLPAGFYNMSIETIIDVDDNLLDNTVQREIEIVCA